MKTLITFLICSLYVSVLFSQETSSRYFGIKNYLSLKIQKEDVNFSGVNDVGFILDSVQHIDLKIVRPGFNIFTKKGHFHEIVITELQLFKTETVTNYQFNPSSFGPISGSFGEGTEKTNNFGLRYQFNYALMNNKTKVYIGAGVEGYYFKEGYVPEFDLERERYTRFEYYKILKGMTVQVIPRVILPISEKVFLDFNTVLSAYKIERSDYDKWKSTDDQNFINFNHNYTKVLPIDFECSIGIGYKIGR